jgi:Na+:H+ antiporter, NhaC family
MSKPIRKPFLWEAFIPIFFLIVFLAVNVYIFGDEAVEGSNQIVLILSALVAGLVSYRAGIRWKHVEMGIASSIKAAMPSMLILLLIGSLAGTWLISGIVPAMIFYGLQILNPVIFLFAACTICAVVSIATGSSWSTVATIGIALIGIGKALGLSEGIVAGAIISGAYFGDKMSPLSDTTNLAPAMAGTDIFTHIRHMTFTTVPSIAIALVLFLAAGFTGTREVDAENVQAVLLNINDAFYISPVLFLVPLIVIAMIIKKVPAIPSLLTGTLLGGLFAIIFQPQVIIEVSGIADNFGRAAYIAVMKAIYTQVSIVSDNAIVNDLLSTYGMSGMLNTVWLILSAMVFGGTMEAGGLLQRITEEVIKMAKSTGSLIASTVGTCIFFNITASDQYLAIIVPGRMFADTYRERGLKPENLSRTLEDSGTVTSVLVPWNTCGATQSSVLQVPTLTYLPYCFFNIISPLMTMAFGIFRIKITRITKADEKHVD